MKQTTAGQVQLQAKDGIRTVTAQLDQETLRHLQSVHKAVREILGMEVSQTVIIRRAIRDLWCHFLEGLVEREETCETPEERLKFQSEWNTNERCRLADAAGRVVLSKHRNTKGDRNAN